MDVFLLIIYYEMNKCFVVFVILYIFMGVYFVLGIVVIIRDITVSKRYSLFIDKVKNF